MVTLYMKKGSIGTSGLPQEVYEKEAEYDGVVLLSKRPTGQMKEVSMKDLAQEYDRYWVGQ